MPTLLVAACCLFALPHLPSDVSAGEPAAAPDIPKATGEAAKAGPPGRTAKLAELAPANLGLRVNERLVYDIRINAVPAGKALLEVQGVEGEEKVPQAWQIRLTTRSTRAVSWFFYDVDDLAKSKIDTKGGFSRFYSMRRNEGEIKTRETIHFNYDIGSMEAVYERPRSDGQLRAYKVPLTGKVLDPLAALYYLRALKLPDLQPDDVRYLPICAEARVWNTALKVKALERIDVGYLRGRLCVVFEPEVEFRGLFERKGKMLVWVDVATGIPLKMAAETPIGLADVVLSDAKGSPLPEKR